MVLENHQHEAFAQYVAAGMPANVAYAKVGYKPADSNASRLMLNDKVKERIIEIQTEAGERVQITKAKVMAELAKVAFVDLGDLAVWNDSGVTWKSRDEMTKEQRQAIASIKQTMNEHGGTTELKLHDKLKALEMIGKELGMFSGKPKAIPADIKEKSTEELIAILTNRNAVQ